MSRRRAQVVVLCEDKQQRAFISRLLRGLGYPPAKVRVLPMPIGRGSAEKFVRTRYPEEAHEIRRHTYQNRCLVVVIDADDKPVDERHRQLDEELIKSNRPPRQPGERIVILVPKRNIETWIHCLHGNAVNEDDIYPKLKHESDCKPAVDRLLELYRSNQPPSKVCPASLVAALRELARLK